ncbi:MAG: UDP-2,3-diacylglucosamine diphosphatase [Bacteroidota bacterium]
MLKKVDTLSSRYIYFASDFHLGAPTEESSRAREKKIVRWLDTIKEDAHSIYLLGDIFDFWFEYSYVIPRGFIRLQSKLIELVDSGIPIYFFSGNHDMWMFDYFPTEFGIPVYHKEMQLIVGNQKLLIGHGDGLGPGDKMYKVLKKIFRNKFCQWLFARIHPNLGISIANYWSKSSRISNIKKGDDDFKGDKEFLLQYSRSKEQQEHHDYYVFGHRHLPLNLEIGNTSKYINLGEWVNYYTYGRYDGEQFELLTFEES